MLVQTHSLFFGQVPQMAYKLLIVDDDTELCELLAEYLGAEGFDITQCHDGQQAVGHLQEQHREGSHYDAIVLDFMLPGLQGLDVLQRLRTFSQTPVIMLTARGEDIDRIVGLEAGADDYLPKPCNPRELLARLRAVMRRAGDSGSDKKTAGGTLERHGICLDTGNRTSTVNNQLLDLTSAEFNTLAALMSRAGEVVMKEDLTELALNRKHTRYDRSIDVHISSIRKKLAEYFDDTELIKTVRGSGYIFINQIDA